MRGHADSDSRNKRTDSEQDGNEVSVWQRDGCEEAVGEVLQWLRGEDLRRAGAVCLAWRNVSLQPSLWRKTVLPSATPQHLRALKRALTSAQLHSDSSWCHWTWHREYLLSAARWALQDEHVVADGACVTHAALSHKGDRLAVTADNATLTMWERSEAESCVWRISWRRSEHNRGWASAGAVRWAPDDRRLLVAGPLALADRWEIVVLCFDESEQVSASVRAESGPSGGWWVDDVAFVAVTLRLLAPARAVSTLWLNAAEQRVQSEYAGVTTPALRIYNESAAHISHMVVTNAAAEDLNNFKRTCSKENIKCDAIKCCPDPFYWHATLPRVGREHCERVVVLAMGVKGGERGVARALAAWQLPLRGPTPLYAEESLAERVRRRNQRPYVPPADVPPPSEEELRALCTPPLATYKLRYRVLGLQLHPNGGCVWATTRSGAECVSVPTLRPLLRLSAPDVATPALELPYLVQPAVSDDFIVTPAGDGSTRVRVWAARSGVGAGALNLPTPATAALFASHPQHLLVLAGDSVYVWTCLVQKFEDTADRI